MMKTNQGFAYAYNAQAAADEFSQVIVASYITQAAVDINQLPIMLQLINDGLGAAAWVPGRLGQARSPHHHGRDQAKRKRS